VTASPIDGCPEYVDLTTGKRYFLADGGRYSRLGDGWVYERTHYTMVTVPATIAELEARDPQRRAA
jgi:hypothetical protein